MLSIQQAVERLLAMWDPLYKYFEEVKEVELVSAMQGKELKIYLQFQSIFLKKFTSINLLFQKEVSQIFRARDEICKLYINLAANILKKSVLINGQIKFLEPFRILTMNLDDPDDMKIYMLKDLSNKENTKICEVF